MILPLELARGACVEDRDDGMPVVVVKAMRRLGHDVSSARAAVRRE
jgi:hypothetical protein